MDDLNLNELDRKAQNGELTEENINDILKTMREISEQSDDLKILNDIKENPLLPGTEGTVGKIGRTNVMLDPTTGAKINICGSVEPMTEENLNTEVESKIKDIVDNISENPEITEDKFKINVEDIPAVTNTIFNIPEDAQEENSLSDAETLKIMEIITRVQNGEKFNIYNEFPPTIKKMVDNTLHLKGYGDHSIQSNTIRNQKCLEIIGSYIGLISKEKYNNSFIKQLEQLQQSESLDLSRLYNDYNSNKQDFLETLLESLDQNDPRRDIVSKKLDIIQDSYTLKPLIDFVSNNKVKVKPIEYEKPQQRIYDIIESKYRYNDNYHIVSIHNALQILGRHNKKEDKENLKFFAAFSKMCMNMSIEDSDNHLLIYSILRNIVFLDVFKGTEYDKFAEPFLKNIDFIISKVK